MALAIDFMNGHDLSNKMCYECLSPRGDKGDVVLAVQIYSS